MPNVKISALPAVTVPALTDVLPVVQGGVTKQCTIAQVVGFTQTVTVNLTSSNILNLLATPIQIVAAPGANKLIIPKWCVVEYTFGTVAYVNISGSSGLYYNNGTGSILAIGSLNGAFTPAANAVSIFNLNSSLPNNTKANTVNANIALQHPGANFASGDGTAKITLAYTVIDTTI